LTVFAKFTLRAILFFTSLLNQTFNIQVKASSNLPAKNKEKENCCYGTPRDVIINKNGQFVRRDLIRLAKGVARRKAQLFNNEL
jgi:hypothetical protein